MCDDIEATVAELEAAGVEFVDADLRRGLRPHDAHARARRRRARPLSAHPPQPAERRLTRGATMAKTHYFPSDQVHFTWDAGNAPVLTIESGDTVVVHTRDVSDDQIGPDSTVDVIAGLDWDRVYPLAGPIAVDGAEPGDTLAVEVLDLHTQGWGWTAILPGLGLLPDDFPDRLPADLRPLRRRRRPTSARTSRSRSSPSWARWASARPGASAQPVMPPGTLRRQHGHAPAHARHHAVPARPGRRRAVQLRRRPRRPGRRRGVRDRPRVADVRRPALHAAQGPPDPGAAVPHRRAADPARGRRAVVRDDRRRPRPVRRRPGGGARDGRPPLQRARPLARGRLPALQPRASTCGSRRSSTPASTSSARCCRWRSSPTRRLAG